MINSNSFYVLQYRVTTRWPEMRVGSDNSAVTQGWRSSIEESTWRMFHPQNSTNNTRYQPAMVPSIQQTVLEFNRLGMAWGRAVTGGSRLQATRDVAGCIAMWHQNWRMV